MKIKYQIKKLKDDYDKWEVGTKVVLFKPFDDEDTKNLTEDHIIYNKIYTIEKLTLDNVEINGLKCKEICIKFDKNQYYLAKSFRRYED